MAARRPKKMGEWRDEAACIKSSENFYPERNQAQAARAKAVCKGCPVREKCLTEAINNGERFGIWGAMDQEERRKEARRRRVSIPLA